MEEEVEVGCVKIRLPSSNSNRGGGGAVCEGSVLVVVFVVVFVAEEGVESVLVVFEVLEVFL